MSTETQTGAAQQRGTVLEWWQAGIVGGLVAGVVFGVLMHLQMTSVLETAIPEGMYGLGEGVALGWAMHLVHSVVLALVFVGVVEHTPLDDLLEDNLTNGVGGLVYGLVLWAVLAMLVMPIWVTGDVGAAPNDFSAISLLGHALFGLVVGLTYSVLAEQ